MNGVTFKQGSTVTLFRHLWRNLLSFLSILAEVITVRALKALANEDTLLPTQMFPRLAARATFVAETNSVSGTKNVSDFVQKHFVSATNVYQFVQPKKHHGQQCVGYNVSSFTRALSPKFSVRTTSSHKFLLINRWDVDLTALPMQGD